MATRGFCTVNALAPIVVPLNFRVESCEPCRDEHKQDVNKGDDDPLHVRPLNGNSVVTAEMQQ